MKNTVSENAAGTRNNKTQRNIINKETEEWKCFWPTSLVSYHGRVEQVYLATNVKKWSDVWGMGVGNAATSTKVQHELEKKKEEEKKKPRVSNNVKMVTKHDLLPEAKTFHI